MSHKPMVYSEKPIKTRTLDLMHKAELDRRENNKPAGQQPSKAGTISKPEKPP